MGLGGYSRIENYFLEEKDILKLFTLKYLDKIVPEKISSSVMYDITNYISVNRFSKEDCYFLLSNLNYDIKRFGERQIELYRDKIAITSKLNKSKIQLYEETIEKIMETRLLLINKYDTYMLNYDNEKEIILLENKFDRILPETVVIYFKKHLLTTGYLADACRRASMAKGDMASSQRKAGDVSRPPKPLLPHVLPLRLQRQDVGQLHRVSGFAPRASPQPPATASG